MRLSIATNWDRNLIQNLSDHPIMEFYGSTSKTPVGGGRPSKILPDVSLDYIESYISEIHTKGWLFNYVLNSTCQGSRINDGNFRKKVYEHIGQLKELKIDSITVANPYMLEFIKTNHPEIKVKVSVFADTDGINKAMLYDSLGADNIALSIMKNRDFEFLKAARKVLKCELTLLVNQGCLFQCPYMTYHANTNAHASLLKDNREGPSVMYCLIQCTLQKMKDPEQLIKSPWIRPEDLCLYEEMGYDIFKISGREKSTEWLTNTANAYSNRHYKGNLLDIVNGVTVLEALPQSRGIPELIGPEIDNQALSDFLSVFKTDKCINDCIECKYCRTYADKAVKVYSQENEMLLEILEYYSSSMF